MAIFLNKELVQRFDRTDFEYTRLRMQAIKTVAGDAVGIEFFDSGKIMGLLAKVIPNPFFNRILGDFGSNIDALGDLMRRYPDDGKYLSLEVSPGAASESLARQLSSSGFAHTSFHPVLSARCEDLAPAPTPVHVERVRDSASLEAFKDVYVDGWDVAPGFAPTMRRYIDEWMTFPEWALYLARVDGKPACAGVLHRSGDIGYLADAATARALRGKGGQKAVLLARIRDTLDAGCRYIMSRAEFDSISQHNMETCGLRVSYTRAVWTRIAQTQA